jgi:hypothetical protein
MCFSAGASFGAGIVLSAIGVATLSQAKSPAEKFFGSIPLLFGVQQCSEGLLWLALSNPAYVEWKQLGTYGFLAFAYIVWPIWIPIALTWLEHDRRRKKILLFLTGIGAAVSGYFLYCLLTFSIAVSVADHHIAYKPDFPLSLKYISITLYVIATIAPAFVSSRKRMWTLGATLIFSYGFTFLVYTNHVVSVWCFFATLISVAVWVVLRAMNPRRDLAMQGQPFT